MALSPMNSSNLEQLALNGLSLDGELKLIVSAGGLLHKLTTRSEKVGINEQFLNCLYL